MPAPQRRADQLPGAPAGETLPGAPGSNYDSRPPMDDDDYISSGANEGRSPLDDDADISSGANDSRPPPDDDDDDDIDNGGGDREPWYSWNRWKYIGGALFLVISAAGVGYVIWDIVDLLPRPVTIETIRAALRESPGRITDVVALAGLISFGPPAGVDLMFGAKKAADGLYKRMRREDKARWKAEGHAEGRAEERKDMIADLRARANGNAELNRLLDEMENDRQ